MAELKTRATDSSVATFLAAVKDPGRRADCEEVLQIMRQATGAEPKMWGTSIVGFGDRTYVYDSGRTGDWFLAGFSPRAQNLTLYIMSGFAAYDELMSKLGKYSTGKSCLYIKRLDDIHRPSLKKLVKLSVAAMKKQDAGKAKPAAKKAAKKTAKKKPPRSKK